MRKNILLIGLVVVIVLILIFLFIRNSSQNQSSRMSIGSSDSAKNVSEGNVPAIPLSLPQGYVIHTFSSDLNSPRDLVFSPGGTLLITTPYEDSVLALPDKDNNGIADTKKTVINGENHPHGIAFYNNQLFVADVDKVVRYNWDEEKLTASLDKVLFSLPENSNHVNRTIVFNKSGDMFVSVGSTCNVCNEEESFSGTIVISNSNGDNPRIYSPGHRNAPFMAFNPSTDKLWATGMGRDFLGDDLPPDEINIVEQGNDYGWPNCYGNKVPDKSFNSNANCDNTTPPVFEIPAHSSPLGLVFIESNQFPKDWQNDLLVAYHGSWNRTAKTGYKVVHMNIEKDRITKVDDFLTGFLQAGITLGRPVDLVFDKAGNLYLSDDSGGNVYIIQKN